MAEHDDGSPRLLSCGVHTSHSPAEEKRWILTEFCTETERQQKLFPSLIAYLKRKALITPGPYPPVPNTWNTQRIYEAKQHFAFLRNRLPRNKYLEQVAIYERSLADFLALPPCGRDLRGFPLLPSTIAGSIQVADLPTPRNGGVQRDPYVQRRNSRIAELKKANIDYPGICQTLDKEKIPVPQKWREGGIQTWRQAYEHRRESVQTMFSKA